LKITRIEPRAIQEPGGRRYVVVKVSTDEGVTGFGEGPAAPEPQIAVDLLKRDLAPAVGEEAVQAVRLDLLLQRSDASAGARAALNIALLDILAKSSDAPLYEALGGPTRNKARAMAVIEAPPEGLRDGVLQAKRAGHLAFSVPLPMPAGLERGRSFYVGVREMMDGLRAAAGEECDFVLDCGGKLTPGEALSISDRLRDFHPLWLDEPCGNVNAASQATISLGSVTPVGFGRDFTENAQFQDLLRENGIDVLRPDIAYNGITNIRKAAAIAETYYIATAPYHRGGPIGTAAGIHISASLPNSFIQEAPFSLNDADRDARSEMAGGWDELPEEGFFELPEMPGLGIDVDEEALTAYTVAS
jgi:galactonate dehydratase